MDYLAAKSSLADADRETSMTRDVSTINHHAERLNLRIIHLVAFLFPVLKSKKGAPLIRETVFPGSDVSVVDDAIIIFCCLYLY
jgi:hypothetical protein